MLVTWKLHRDVLRHFRFPRVVGVPIALVLSLVSCQDDSIPFPTNDATPPLTQWTLVTPDNVTQTALGNAALAVDTATDVRVTCKAWDNEGGIKSITSGGFLFRSCSWDGRTEFSAVPPLSSNHTLLPSGKVNVSSFTSGDYHLQFDGCSNYAGELKLTCTAVNYVGGKTTSQLSVVFYGG